jgi:hypothetical protein
MNNLIDYKKRMRAAMLNLVRGILTDVKQNGLPGSHHFYISFETQNIGVELSDWLKQKYPDEMTIVIQNWYENFYVEKDFFQITLNFGNQPETMKIPFEALNTFVDPSVEFGLTFDRNKDIQNFDEPEIINNPDNSLTEPSDDPPPSGDVIDFSTFRKP